MNYVIGVEKINNVYCALVLHSRCVLECLLLNVLECWSKFAGKELKSVPALLFINISLTGYSNGCFMCSNMRQAFFLPSHLYSVLPEKGKRPHDASLAMPLAAGVGVMDSHAQISP